MAWPSTVRLTIRRHDNEPHDDASGAYLRLPDGRMPSEEDISSGLRCSKIPGDQLDHEQGKIWSIGIVVLEYVVEVLC